MSDELSGPQDDAKVFLEATPEWVTLTNGDKYPVPKCSWGTEMKLVRLLGEIIANASNLGVFSPDGARPESQGDLVSLLFGQTPEKLTAAAAAILKQPEEWICDNLDGEALLGVVLPFLRSRLEKILGAVTKQAVNIQQTVAAVARMQ